MKFLTEIGLEDIHMAFRWEQRFLVDCVMFFLNNGIRTESFTGGLYALNSQSIIWVGFVASKSVGEYSVIQLLLRLHILRAISFCLLK